MQAFTGRRRLPWHHDNMMSVGVILWSAVLPVVAAANIVGWTFAAVALWRRKGILVERVLATRRLQLLLSAGYVFGCAYRSVLPVFDVPRVALVDSVLSSSFVGRSVATVAELCFIAQWALMLRDTSRATGSQVGSLASRAVIPLIAVAEICSWYSVLTTSNLGHVFEESLWSVSTALIVASLVAAWPRWDARWRPAIVWLSAAGLVYFAYLVLVDVPMYWSRWMVDEAAGRPYLTLAQGLTDTLSNRIVSYRWEIWKSEIAWMSLYFSVAVWTSIWLVHAPLPRPHLALRRQRRSLPLNLFGFRVVPGRRH
jgi:hypothetical protein